MPGFSGAKCASINCAALAAAVRCVAVSGDLIEREEGLAHGERVAEVRAGGVGVVVAEAAAGEAAVDDDPLRGALRFGECGGVAAGGVEVASAAMTQPFSRA